RPRWPYRTGTVGRASIHASPSHEAGLRDLSASTPQRPHPSPPVHTPGSLAKPPPPPPPRRFADGIGLVRPCILAAPRLAPARKTPDLAATTHDSLSAS
ncbi:hypothetical protein PVAP13_6KG050535, partial [Panicum virgatum]